MVPNRQWCSGTASKRTWRDFARSCLLQTVKPRMPKQQNSPQASKTAFGVTNCWPLSQSILRPH